MRRGRNNQGNLGNSSNKDNALRPAPVTTSRQEESNKDKPVVFWDEVLESGREDNIQPDTQTMAQVWKAKQKRLEMEQRKKRQLLLEVDCNEKDVPEKALLNTSLIYAALTEQMGLTDERSKQQVEAIYQPDPSNYCKWSILLSSQDLKDKLEHREVK